MRLVLLGPPGVGKGTLGASLSASLGVSHLSTGELLRAAIRAGDEEARVILSGAFVSDEAANRLILPAIAELSGFILDGYPRTLVQAEALSGATTLDGVLLLELGDAALEERVARRRVCGACGMPGIAGICEACGGVLVARPEEDTSKKRATRTRLYRERTAPLIAYYERVGLLWRIDASGSPEKVVELAQKTLGIS